MREPVLPPGTRMGPYEIVGLLGVGGMGEVFRARDPRLGRDVAIKVLPGALMRDAEATQRFEREARAVAALSHPNILAIHDFGTQDGHAYAVMELLVGETLQARLADGPLGWKKAATIAAAIADGLAAAHAAGIIHRDLKPANLFLTADNRVKILDFGLAKLSPTTSSDVVQPTISEAGMVMGTANYMSPEQATGARLDVRSDIFSFGCVLYEMLTGARPFARESTPETMTAILKDDPPPIVAGEVPAELQRIVLHCLEKNREARFQSARDLAFALQSLQALQSQPAVPASPPAPPAPAHPAAAEPSVTSIVARPFGGQPHRTRRWPIALAAITGLPMMFVLGWLAHRPAIAPEPPATLALTQGTAREFSPVLSPDGKYVAYLSDAAGEPDVWVKFVGGGPPVNLTDGSGLEIASNTIIGGLDISPDGTGIAVTAGPSGDPQAGGGVWVVPAPLGGPPRKLISKATALRWSPDGARLAFVRPNMVKGDAIATAGADGQDEVILFPGLDGVHLHHPAWSHDGAWIYFIRTIEPNNGPPTEIWRAPSKGGAPERVFATSGVAHNPTPTSDGLGLVYAGDRTGDGLQLWWRSLANGAERRLTTGAGEYVEPRLSRDGRRLACTARRSLESIVTASAITPDQPGPYETLTGRRSGDGEPSICPSTGQMVFSSSRNGIRHLWTTGVRGAAARQLTSGNEPDHGPAMSPDCKSVAFISERGLIRGVWIVPAEGGAPRRLVSAHVLDRVSWSPDGASLVYTQGSEEGDATLQIIAAEGGEAHPIPGVSGRLPAWSPAEDVIAYVGQAGLRFTDRRGTPVTSKAAATLPSVIGAVAWSHDGAKIAVGSAPGAQPGIWVLDLTSGAATRALQSTFYWMLSGIEWAADDAALVFGRIEYESHVLLLDGLP